MTTAITNFQAARSQRPQSKRAKRSKRRKAAHRQPQAPQPIVDGFRAQHLALAQRQIVTELGRTSVLVDETESPLVWLARRRGRDGRALIEVHELQAGERLRADFTRAHLMPRTTANWSSPLSSGRHAGGERAGALTDTVIAARQSVHLALDAVGPEFSGLLLDICCFLKGLEDIERERAWPARSGKVVLQLALARLARHYGYSARARGPARAPVRTWLADDAAFGVESV
ncbi:MAG TPA: DUF6456 domain-containing protein [Pseudolabrys sp.]|jgi:hypothetical protein|nr:DUF6456 domain-containing protein [Pseudolabrys sp.]